MDVLYYLSARLSVLGSANYGVSHQVLCLVRVGAAEARWK